MDSHEMIKNVLVEYCEKVGAPANFSLDQPEDSVHGDYATNVSFLLSKIEKTSPKVCAENLVPKLQESLKDIVQKIEVAGPGFINFFISQEARAQTIHVVAKSPTRLETLFGKTVVCEYTDPNPFKLFHIGHLVSNAVGESLSRIHEQVGAKVVRICYQGDVGMHVATTIWGIEHLNEVPPEDSSSLRDKVAYLGRGYAYGTQALVDKPLIKDEIVVINRYLFEGKEHELYAKGRKWSLDYFQTLYDKLGTSFDFFIFESEVADRGKKLVQNNTPKIFEQSEGAYVYKGDKVGLHTRVFVNGQGFPTYEAKELGNCLRKEELIPNHDISIAITGNEVNDYFRVICAALKEVLPDYAKKFIHISHGMLRLPEGKMSSRTGNIISAEDLIDEVKKRLSERLEKSDAENKDQLANDIAIGAIKFSILKQATGRDIIFDIEKSISFEGDSGPYLQYTHARIVQLLKKASGMGIEARYIHDAYEVELERKIIIFSEVIQNAYKENGPHHIVNYLLSLTHEFNSLYARQVFVDKENLNSFHYVLLAQATGNILRQGLYILGIKAPEKM